MDSKEILRQTIEQPFNEQKFRQFIADFLNDYNVVRSSLTSFFPSFSDHINHFNLLGEYQDSQGKKLHILEVELKNTHKLESARTAQRNLVAKYLEDNWIDGALVGFWAPDSPRWRFSFVKIAWEFDKENKKTKKILSPAKRYSYLIGEGEPSHTAQFQLLPALEQEKNPVLSQIEEAFSVERVTKEFYREYKQLFDKLCEELEKNRVFQGIKETKRIDTGNFAKKLLGQIVFLYFIQKKGWLGVSRDKKWGEGDRAFLRHLFERAKKEDKNFFNNYLKELFYNALNNPRRGEADPSYSKYFECKIPFLNGGLFEPMKGYDWQDFLLFLNNDSFSNAEDTGVLDVFDKYNFTVKEDEPLEKEVAVDPEMLGKVFENLLEEHLRKGKGTYYTPREIVHYMCRESLINYLTTESELPEEKIRKLVTIDKIIDSSQDLRKQIKEKSLPLSDKETVLIDNILTQIKVCDPACGSGAFLVGMLQEIVQVRNKMTGYLTLFDKDIGERTDYELKKKTIQNCIYGVDIDPGAVEIAKLRLWLSLVVDYELEQIEPLPNLDYKVMQGNSLLEELVLGDTTIKLFDPSLIKGKEKKMKNLFEEEKQKDLFEKDSPVKKIMEQLDKLRKEYFKVSDLSEKLELRRQIEDIEQNLVKQCVDREIRSLETQIKNIGDYITPGIGLRKEDAEKIGKKLSLQAQIIQMWQELRESGVRPFFLWHLYFADVFQQKDGFDIVIANPPYGFRSVLTADEKKFFRQIKKIEFSSGDSAELFSKQCFDNLVKEAGILTFIIPKKSLYGDSWEGLRIDYWKPYNLLFLLDSSKAFENVLLEQAAFSLAKIRSVESFVRLAYLSKKDEVEEFAHIRKDDIFMINNTVQIYKAIIPEELFNKINNNKTVEKLVEGELGLAIGRDFFSEKPTEYKLLKGIDIIRWRIKQHRYLKNKQKLNWKEAKKFLKSKVIAQRIIAHIDNPFPHIKIIASYDNEGILITNTLMSFALDNKLDYRFWLAYLNSTFISWYAYSFIYSRAIRTMDFYNFYIQQIPIPLKIINQPEKQKLFIGLVDKILTSTKSDDYLQNEAKQKKVKEYENQIDQMVYKLYGLTKEEIKIIENHG